MTIAHSPDASHRSPAAVQVADLMTQAEALATKCLLVQANSTSGEIVAAAAVAVAALTCLTDAIAAELSRPSSPDAAND